MKSPLPIFDTLEQISLTETIIINNQYSNNKDIIKAHGFLKSYSDSKGTFNAYRREIERLLHWCFIKAQKSLKELKREDIENFIKFCQNPPKSWIGINKVPRFIIVEGERRPNTEWRPFVVTISKAAYNKGERPRTTNFELSQGAVKDLFAILGSFYNYLLQDEYVSINPVAIIRQKSKFLRKTHGKEKIRRLSEL
jgi:site-specific recombinase XerD